MKSLKPRLLTAAIGIPAVVLVMILAELWHPLIGIVVGLASAWMVLEYLAARKLNSIVPLPDDRLLISTMDGVVTLLQY